MPGCIVARLAYDAGELTAAFLQDGRIALVHLEAGLDNYRFLSETGMDFLDIRDTVRDDAVGVVSALLACPVGVKRHPDHVVVHTVFLKDSEVLLVDGEVPAVIQVDYGLRTREYTFCCLMPGLDESGVLLRREVDVADSVGVFALGTAHRAPTALVVPEQSVRGFIAYLDPSRFDAIIFQELQYLDGMGTEVFLHLFEGMAFPGFRHRLVLRVCPVVRVVEIHHYGHALSLGAATLLQEVFLVAETACRINPYAESQGVETQFLHEGAAFLRISAFEAVQAFASGLHLRSPADVGTQPESLVFGRLDRPFILVLVFLVFLSGLFARRGFRPVPGVGIILPAALAGGRASCKQEQHEVEQKCVSFHGF